MPMHEGEEPVLAIEGGPQWFIQECYQGGKLKSIPASFLSEGLNSFVEWFRENERREWEALGNMSREEQYGCVLMEIASAIAKGEEDESNRENYFGILKEVLKNLEMLADSEDLMSNEGFSDLWLVLTESRIPSLNHLETFRVSELRTFKEAVKQSIGKKKLRAKMFVLVNQYGRAERYFADTESAVAEVQSYKKLKGKKLAEKKGKYSIEEQVLDPVTGKTKSMSVMSRHVVR